MHLAGEFLGVPVVGAGEEGCGVVLFGLGGGELVGVGIAGGGVGAGAGGFVFGVEGGVEVVGLAGVPFQPACGSDVIAHDGVEVDDGGVGTPRAAEEDVRFAGLGGEAAVD